MVINFNPKRHGLIELVAEEARAQFDDVIAVMRIGEIAKSDMYQVVCENVPGKISNGRQRSVVIICDLSFSEDFLNALEAGIHPGERHNYWLRVWR